MDNLLAGVEVGWADATGEMQRMTLASPPQRRLFDFLRTSNMREEKELQVSFVEGLWASYLDGDDPAAVRDAKTSGYKPVGLGA